MHIAITGATGFVGSALVPLLRGHGHRVTRLVRTGGSDVDDSVWDPASGMLDDEVLRSADAVVHLAGENFEGKWDDEKRRRIWSSRVDGAQLIADRLGKLDDGRDRVFVTASALGYYGSRGDEVLTEDSPRGEGFVAEMCEAVENAARTDGARVVRVRIGIVQSPRGGMLGAQLPLFRKGLGARLGLGRRHLSWIALDDLVRVFEFAVTTPGLSGPVNAVAPHPVTNAEYTRTLARAVHRPSVLAIPPFMPRLALGAFADEVLLQSALVRPAVLIDAGFEFHHPELDEALRHLVAP
jgi:uncharacterized protein (TIGR01777 family)